MDAPGDVEPVSTVSYERPSPQDFYTFVPYACSTYEFDFSVKINVVKQAEYIRSDAKPKKARQSTHQGALRTSKQAVTPEELEDLTEEQSNVLEVVLTAVQDAGGNLVELVFNRCIEIPRQLIKVIGMCVPYQPQLYRLTVRWTPLASVALYEFSKFMSKLTELCLDDSPVAGRIYEVLLKRLSCLYYLSLSRCKLDDEDCALLAAQLTPPQPAATSLRVLLLASNKIGDEGARVFANILRNNRGLRYLDLAGNHITDSGAISIFKTLMEFSLRTEEVRALRMRHIDFLRRRADVYANYIKELSQEKSSYDVPVSKRKSTRVAKMSVAAEMNLADDILHRAETLTDDFMGNFIDPFNVKQTIIRDKQMYCIGNLALCGLNLSYNNLEFSSVTWLSTLLIYQSLAVPKALTYPGLLRVHIDGNNLPLDCDEFLHIQDLLEQAVTRERRRNMIEPKSLRTRSKVATAKTSRLDVAKKSPSI